MKKRKVLFATSTAAAGETITQGLNVDWQMAVYGYNKMDVIINVKTLSGTSPTLTVSVQEQFNGTDFIETAKSAALSAIGAYGLAQQTVPNAAATKITGAFPMLGKGDIKRIVTTAGGTVGSISVEVWFVFFED